MDETHQHAYDRQREIARALIQRSPHVRLYDTSPHFRQAIDTLAGWLPGWVNAMADQAHNRDIHTAYLAELAKRGPVQVVLTPGDPVAEKLLAALDQGTPIARQEIQGDAPPRYLDWPPARLQRHDYAPADINEGADLPCCDMPEDDDIHVVLPLGDIHDHNTSPDEE